MSEKAFKVLLVDDHPIVRRGLREIISREKDLEVCGEAGSATEAMEQIDETSPDLVIVDLSLNETGGLELIKQIRATDQSVKMLVATMHDEAIYAERSLHAGANGYINKEEATDHLIGAVRQVLRGKTYLSEEMTQRFLERARVGANDDKPLIESLSDRELEVFALFGEGLTTREIAERLSRSVKTVESHRESIRSKLNIASSTELVHRATLWVREERG